MADEPTPDDQTGTPAAGDDTRPATVASSPTGDDTGPAAGDGEPAEDEQPGDEQPGDDRTTGADHVEDDRPAGDDRPEDDRPAGDDHVDELPEDLDAAGFVGPYLFPNNNRRRVPGYLYLATAAVCAAVWALVDDSPYVNDGFLFAAVLLGIVGVYQLVSGWNLDVDEQDALVAASRAVGFPVGHASAQMGWRGLLSRPTWRILLYSAENPPARRGLVLVDGVDGEVIQHFVEDNPEDWTDLDTDSA